MFGDAIFGAEFFAEGSGPLAESVSLSIATASESLSDAVLTTTAPTHGGGVAHGVSRDDDWTIRPKPPRVTLSVATSSEAWGAATFTHVRPRTRFVAGSSSESASTARIGLRFGVRITTASESSSQSEVVNTERWSRAREIEKDDEMVMMMLAAYEDADMEMV